MVTRKKYLKALKIVKAYHQQIENEVSEFQKKLENSKSLHKNKEDLKAGDFVECVEVHGNSKDSLTVGKKYEVRRTKKTTNSLMFYIYNDKDQLRHYKDENTQFKALN